MIETYSEITCLSLFRYYYLKFYFLFFKNSYNITYLYFIFTSRSSSFLYVLLLSQVADFFCKQFLTF
jgi:hypothetical protein